LQPPEFLRLKKSVSSILAGPIKASEVMNRRVVKISPDASLAEAARLMLSLDIGSLLVMEGDELKGILTKSDFARLVTRKAEAGTVKEIMSSPVKTTSPDTDLVEVANIMRVNRIRHVPVVDGGKVVGLVTDFDIACYATSELGRILTMLKPPKL
jgi:CBS domain-containing protein